MFHLVRAVTFRPGGALNARKPIFTLRNFFSKPLVSADATSPPGSNLDKIIGSIRQERSASASSGADQPRDFGSHRRSFGSGGYSDRQRNFEGRDRDSYGGGRRNFGDSDSGSDRPRGRGGRGRGSGGFGGRQSFKRYDDDEGEGGDSFRSRDLSDRPARTGGSFGSRGGGGRGGRGGRGGGGGFGDRRGRGGGGRGPRGSINSRPSTAEAVLESYIQQQREGTKTAAAVETPTAAPPQPVAPAAPQAANLERMEQQVKVTGTNIPPPIAQFSEVVKNEQLLKNIENAKYTTPTPIQRYSLPILFAGRDMLATSQTGTGKTAAFLLPILQTLLDKQAAKAKEPHHREYHPRGQRTEAKPAALVLVPTRELAVQVAEESHKLTHGSRLGVATLYGGVGYEPQLRSLNSRCALVVATPGRLRDIIDRAHLSFSNIQHVVLDEADRMLDMGFEPQIRAILEHEQMAAADKRHTAMFSATFPREIRALASDFMRKDYAFVEVGREGSTLKTIKQDVVYAPEEKKPAMLLALLKQNPNATTLVFTQTKRTADMLTTFMSNERINADAIHSDRSQGAREKALARFRAGKITCLVATDIAARGLDIPSVAHVINYDCPPAIDAYVHRIGRTGRAGREGLATTFINESDVGVVKEIRGLLTQSQQVVPGFLQELLYR